MEPTTITDTKEKMSKKQIIGMIILTIIAIAGVIFGVYGITDSNNKNGEIDNYKSKISLLEKETGAEIIEQEDTVIISTETADSDDNKVKSIVSKIYDGLYEFYYDDSMFFKVFGEGSTIKIPGTDIYTDSNKSYGVHSTFYPAITDKLYDASPVAESVLTSNGYSFEFESLGGKVYHNANDGIYCVTSSGAPYFLDCSNEKWISNEDKELVLSLAEAGELKYVSASVQDIENSSVSPYQKLYAGLMGAVGLFYRVSPESEWVFFKGGQDGILCSEYTEDAAKAFAGEKCWYEPGGQESTVQP